MDNGRFLRRVVRHQKHYGRAMSRLLQMLWKNEYIDLEELVGKKSSSNKGGTKAEDDGESEESKAKDEMEALEVDVTKIVVRYPSPATLNMTNLSDAINQGQPVADFITETLASSEEEPVKAELKKRVIQDLMPQIHWEKYEKLLIDARKDGERKKAGESTGGSAGAEGGAGDGLGGGNDGGDAAFG
jgi:hypothetical protein